MGSVASVACAHTFILLGCWIYVGAFASALFLHIFMFWGSGVVYGFCFGIRWSYFHGTGFV